MGKKEFANQQPTQNLVGRGRRGIHNTARAQGNKVRSWHPASLTPPGNAAELQFGI